MASASDIVPSSALPTEVCEHILTYATPLVAYAPASRATAEMLGNCSLVCRAWLPFCRGAMFEHYVVTICLAQLTQTGAQSCWGSNVATKRFLDVLESKDCTIKPYITHLRWCSCNSTTGSSQHSGGSFDPDAVDISFGVPIEAIKSLRHLKKLELTDATHTQHQYRLSSDVDFLHLTFAGVKELNMRNENICEAEWFCINMLPLFDSLEFLSMHVPHVSKVGSDVSTKRALARYTDGRTILPNIKRVRLLGHGRKRPILEWIMFKVLTFGRVMGVKEFWVEGFTSNDIFLLNQVLKGFGPALEEVSIRVTWLDRMQRIPEWHGPDRPLVQLDISFFWNTSIKNIFIEETSDWRPDNDAYKVFSANMIESICSDKLQSISMAMWLGGRRGGAKAWSAIDEYLMSQQNVNRVKKVERRFKNLQEVRVVVLDMVPNVQELVAAEVKRLLWRCRDANLVTVF